MVLPVSGGCFAVQLAFLQLIVEGGLGRPSLVLASSGGAVAAYTALAAGWKAAGIARIAGTYCSSMFSRKWFGAPLDLPAALYEGTLYREGTGFFRTMSTYLTPVSATATEIWVGTSNLKSHKASLFCNRARRDSQVDFGLIDRDLTQCAEPFYADGDLTLLAAAAQASASIPAVVPPKTILGDPHADGGLYYASPLTTMQDAFRARPRLHLVYINGWDLARGMSMLSGTPKTGRCNIVESTFLATGGLVRGQQLADRLAAYQLIRDGCREVNSVEFAGTPGLLARVLEVWAVCDRSMLELYPAAPLSEPLISVNILKFEGDDVIRVIEEARQVCRCRLYWIGEARLAEYLGLC